MLYKVFRGRYLNARDPSASRSLRIYFGGCSGCDPAHLCRTIGLCCGQHVAQGSLASCALRNSFAYNQLQPLVMCCQFQMLQLPQIPILLCFCPLASRQDGHLRCGYDSIFWTSGSPGLSCEGPPGIPGITRPRSRAPVHGSKWIPTVSSGTG